MVEDSDIGDRRDEALIGGSVLASLSILAMAIFFAFMALPYAYHRNTLETIRLQRQRDCKMMLYAIPTTIFVVVITCLLVWFRNPLMEMSHNAVVVLLIIANALLVLTFSTRCHPHGTLKLLPLLSSLALMLAASVVAIQIGIKAAETSQLIITDAEIVRFMDYDDSAWFDLSYSLNNSARTCQTALSMNCADYLGGATDENDYSNYENQEVDYATDDEAVVHYVGENDILSTIGVDFSCANYQKEGEERRLEDGDGDGDGDAADDEGEGNDKDDAGENDDGDYNDDAGENDEVDGEEEQEEEEDDDDDNNNGEAEENGDIYIAYDVLVNPDRCYAAWWTTKNSGRTSLAAEESMWYLAGAAALAGFFFVSWTLLLSVCSRAVLCGGHLPWGSRGKTGKLMDRQIYNDVSTVFSGDTSISFFSSQSQTYPSQITMKDTQDSGCDRDTIPLDLSIQQNFSELTDFAMKTIFQQDDKNQTDGVVSNEQDGFEYKDLTATDSQETSQGQELDVNGRILKVPQATPDEQSKRSRSAGGEFPSTAASF